MASPKKRQKPKDVLGKGLGAILEEVGAAYANEMSTRDDFSNTDELEAITNINTEKIDPNPYQPRKYFDESKIEELSDSIKRYGLMQPIVVIPNADRFLVVAGERRLRAHILAGIEEIKAIVADVNLDEIRMRELALVENIQRENLNPVELAVSYRELIDVHRITHDELSNIVHKSRSQITNTLRLLLLGQYAQEALINGRITAGHAKILVSLDEQKQKIAVDTIVGQKLNVRDTEKMLARKSSPKVASSKISKYIYKIQKEKAEKILEKIPFESAIKNNKIEIVLQNDEEVESFIAFCNQIH